jgi:DNA repair exonuclease SbcCD ATPase subunit
MRRIVFLSLGVLELCVGLTLAAFAWQLPGPEQVHDGVGRVDCVARQTGDQVGRLREQLHTLRQTRPQMQDLAKKLRDQTQLVAQNLEHQRIDYGTVRTVSDALGDAAKGLDGLSDTLDPKAVRDLGAGLKGTADFLDEKVAPAAARAADHLDQTTEDLRIDAERLSRLLRDAPLDLEAARQIHDSLGKFDDGLGRLGDRLKPDRLGAMRDGFKGMQEALTTSADQVERMAGYTYPVVTLRGLNPSVEQRRFWPEGVQIAADLRRAAKGAAAAVEELDGLDDDLPRLRASLEESRKVAAATRDALGKALEQQDKVGGLLKDVPAHAARLADELPHLGADLSKVLRETDRLKEVAGLLRQAEKGVDAAASRWPELRQSLAQAAKLLRATQGQLKIALDHRAEYEAAMDQTVQLAKTYSAALPLLTEQLDYDLNDQEESLKNLQDSIDQAAAVLPEWDRTASRVLQTTRLLLCLTAAVAGLHGVYLLGTTWKRPGA